ncbi:M20 metallopeptidase family protein [Pseudobacteroides cellulosolvens]|uniref:M20 metallopeptidase family protein n=1 Tax=Pseudobacteroides cellulosolvens TaxID=35825 RepID=UPI000682542A|nr:M20 family metallopeptidase [Pseudobacteroides cellulosolvens]
MLTDKIKSYSEEVFDRLVSIRREIHKYPELGFNEIKTSGLIRSFLEELGLDVYGFAGTGLAATINGKDNGKTVAIRADIDALPIKEENMFEFVSRNVGKMHACGHDGHTAIVLGAAHVLVRLRDFLNGNVKLIFQPAEEGLGGAEVMVNEGVLDNPKVDAIIGAHVSPLINTGFISVRKGPVMASPSEFEIEIVGKSGHAAQPENAVNPITIGAAIVDRFRNIVKPNHNSLKQAILTVTCFNAGSAFNIIPDSVTLKGTIRTFDADICKYIKDSMEEILKEETQKAGALYKFQANDGYPPVINDDLLVDRFIGSAEKIINAKNIITNQEPSMLAEDFSYYSKVVSGTYFHLGCRSQMNSEVINLHSSKFNLDENCIKIGVEIMSQFAFDFINA